MPALTYAVTLYVNGIGTLSIGEQLNFLTLTTGSVDGYDLAQSSQINMEFLVDANDQTIPFWLGRQIQVKITPSDGPAVDVFFGWIDSATITGNDATGAWAVISLAGSGTMSRLGQVDISGLGFGWAATNERTRINAGIANNINDVQWAAYPNAVSWNEINPSQFWFNFGELLTQSRVWFNPTSVTGMSLEAYTAGTTDALSYIQGLATGTQAILWDDPAVNNANYTPFDYWAGLSADDLDVETCVLADSLQAATDMSNIYNTIGWPIQA